MMLFWCAFHECSFAIVSPFHTTIVPSSKPSHTDSATLIMAWRADFCECPLKEVRREKLSSYTLMVPSCRPAHISLPLLSRQRTLVGTESCCCTRTTERMLSCCRRLLSKQSSGRISFDWRLAPRRAPSTALCAGASSRSSATCWPEMKQRVRTISTKEGLLEGLAERQRSMSTRRRTSSERGIVGRRFFSMISCFISTASNCRISLPRPSQHVMPYSSTSRYSRKGICIVQSSQSTMPKLYTSDRSSYWRVPLSSTSGASHCHVPRLPAMSGATSRANPKSATFAHTSLSGSVDTINMFGVRRSRWMMGGLMPCWR
mmetsp:Transcript_12759/g.50951  ORF Transcript_12759/g.50951 Transcript_12759/m.50951 type:complete len:317 (-) Transcript_12759:647-1597(-)